MGPGNIKDTSFKQNKLTGHLLKWRNWRDAVEPFKVSQDTMPAKDWT